MRRRPSSGATLLLLALACLALGCGDRSRTTGPGPGDFDTSFGNSALGAWINDEFGLPAFRYEGCEGACEEPRDAFHQLGNGFSTALAHAGGYVELFTAKTFYRLANRYDEATRSYAGGFGWVRDGDQVWSTLYEDRPAGASYERIFGMGYAKKTVEHRGLRIEQYVYSPPGSDEALLEHLVFTNLTDAAKSIRYFDYWDVAWWLLRHRDPIVSMSIHDPARVETSFDASSSALKATSLAAAGDPALPSLTEDPSPKVSFVTFLDGQPERWDTVQGAFLGEGDRALPERIEIGELANSLDASGNLPSEDATLVTQEDFTLAPRERRELNVLFGIAPRGKEDAVIDRFHDGAPNRLREAAEDWAARTPRVRLPEERWLGREMAWSAYYLLSGMLREDFFGTRVINQGSLYLYDWGANAGPRAALRHVLPVVYIEPESAREVIVYYLRAMRSSGELSYATAGYGGWQPFGFEPSDSSLWLLWAAAEYVFATRDFAFLDQSHDFYCDEGRGRCGSATAYEMLKRAYAYQVDVVGTGPHGLVRLLDSDWDDFLTSFSPDVDPVRTEELGESTMNTAIAVVAYPMFAALAERHGDGVLARAVRETRAALAKALAAQWRGDLFNRAYVYTRDGAPIEVGAKNLWLASNGIALLADDVLDPEQTKRLVERIGRDNLDPSPLGLASQGAPIDPGVGTAGFWYSLAGPALEGLVKRQQVAGARSLAWEAFRRQTLAQHAETYPDIWYGIWSGPDMYFTPLDAAPPTSHPGETWCFAGVLCMRDFPVTNSFSHSEALIGSVRMAGIEANERGLRIDPAFPFDAFEWSSRAFAVTYTASEASGRITALGDDLIELRVRLPGSARASDQVAVHANGRSVAFELEDGMARFTLPVERGVPSSWSVRGRT